MSTWQAMDTAPRDGTPILGWCVHDADPYCADEAAGKLTTYGAHCEGLRHVVDGPHVVQWGGAYDDRTSFEDSDGSYIPDWWFRCGSEWEEAANPIAWQPITGLDI